MNQSASGYHQVAPHLEDFPYWTLDLEGTGGHVGAAPEDFRVEEIPAYEPVGEGEHCLVWIEKRSISTPVAIRRLADALGIGHRQIGYAGLKDSQAITRQWLSVPRVEPSELLSLDVADVRLLSAALHRNKLKTGHLKGNRFAITVRKPAAGSDGVARAQKVAERLANRGMPNLYGPQRFGKKGRNVIKGLEVISGSSRIRDRRRARFVVSAVQSEMFNAYVRLRMEAGMLDRVVEGDILRRGRSFFPVEDAAREQARVDAGEVHLTGPLFGPRAPSPPPSTAAKRWEEEVLFSYGLSEDDLHLFGRRARGGRRDLLARPRHVSASATEESDGAIELRFALPSGSYATVFVREVLKAPFGRLRPLR